MNSTGSGYTLNYRQTKKHSNNKKKHVLGKKSRQNIGFIMQKSGFFVLF